MIGHGGRDADGIMANQQDIYVTSGTGDMANQLGGADGDVTTGGITFIGGDQDRDFAQIGHGGYGNGANDANGFNGNITITSNGGSVVFDGSIEGGTRYARSNNGRSLDGSTLAPFAINAIDAGNEAYIMIGNGGYVSRGTHSGEISITSFGGVDMLGSTNNPVSPISFTTAGGDDLSALTGGVQSANDDLNLWISLSPKQDTAATTANEFGISLGRVNLEPGTLRIVLDDGTIITDAPANSSDERTTSRLVTQDGTDVGNVHYQQGLVRFQAAAGTDIGSGSASVESVEYNSIQGYKERAFVQIGHGGYESEGPNNHANNIVSNSGNINVLAGGDVRFHAGDFHRAYAQFGHGGRDTKGQSFGDITLGLAPGTTGGKLEVLAGNGLRQFDYENYGQVGHGGYEADGNHYGDISITNGSNATDGLGLFFKAGSKEDAYVMLGHGGTNARSGTGDGALAFGLNGDITVQTDGDISFVAGTMSTTNPDYGDDGRLYAKIGHGGYDSDPSNNNTDSRGQNSGLGLDAGTAGAGDGNWGHFGDISLTSTGGNINFMAGDTRALADRKYIDGNAIPISDVNNLLVSNGNGQGILHYAHVGHGGYATGGDHYGDISVIAEDGSVNLVGGNYTADTNANKYNYAQIGHGGQNDGGHMGRSDEKITVHALGANGNVVVAAGFGQSSHAKIGNGGLNVDGTHLGDIEVYAGNDIFMRGGIANARVVSRIGEYGDISGTNGGNGNDLSEFNGYYGTGGLGYLLMDQAAQAGGLTKLIGENIQVGSLEFRLQTNVYDGTAAADYVDDGAGNIVENGNPANIVGTIDYVTGEVNWTTAVLAGADTADQPDIFVNYEHETQIINDARYAAAQIGHGGYSSRSVAGAHAEGAAVNIGHTGDIDVRAGVDAAGAFTGSGGSISALGGNDQRTYVLIGHGGDDSQSAAGHAYRGDITTKADGAITFKGGGGLVDNQNIAFNFGGDGDIESVDQGRSNAGISDVLWSFAQIGHGGYNSDANNSVDNNSNDPLVVQTDTNGHNGDILVETASGNVDFTGGGVRGYGHFAQIGHGGHNTHGNHFGDVTVNSGADINFTGGGSSYRSNAIEKRSYAQIGHGGHGMTGNLLGDIDVDAGGSISFSGGDIASGFSHVPWGAHVYTMNRAGNQDENHSNRTESRQNFALLGHGGSNVYGDKQGNIDVDAGTGIDFNAGLRLDERDDSSRQNFAQIGHGGYFSHRHYRNNGEPAGADRAADFNVFSNLDGTGLPFWPIDNAGNYLPDGFEGNISVISQAGDIAFTGGNSHHTYAMIGHGGVYTGGDHKGDIFVDAVAGNVNFNADYDLHGANGAAPGGQVGSGNQTFTQIGHGGAWSDGEIGAGNVNVFDFNTSTVNAIAYTTNIMVNAGAGMKFDAGDTDSYAMIGHGGHSATGTDAVTWTTPDYLYGDEANYSYRPGSRSGNIEVDAVGDIEFTGGNTDGDAAFVQIGHGGRAIVANPNSVFGDGHSGQIDVTSTGGGITFKAGSRLYDHAMIGHGGTESFGNHGGDGTDGRLDSDITVEASGDIAFTSGTRTNSNADARAFAQIGHGGWKSSFRDIQDVDGGGYAILAPYNAPFPAANTGRHPWVPFTTNPDGLAMTIGTGNLIGTPGVESAGAATLGTFKGDITVRTTGTGDINFRVANDADGSLVRNADESHVQIGHGGYRNFADIEGNITVESAGGIDFAAIQGTGDNNNTNSQGAYALLGHGGYESGGDFSGDIAVSAKSDVTFTGGDSNDGAGGSFAQLGHGGFDADDDSTQYREADRNADGSLKAATGGQLGAGLAADAGHSGNITVTVTDGGNLEFRAGRDSQTYAQLGHGGYSTRDSHNGNIVVNVAGGIAFIASTDGTIGGAGLNPGTNAQSYAMMGHGGYASDGSHFGDITVTAGTFAAGAEAGKGIVFRGGDGDNNFVQMGHGGDGSKTYGTFAGMGEGLYGDITVESGGDILFVAGTKHETSIFDNGDGRQYAQLGHGGYDIDVISDAEFNEIRVLTANRVNMVGFNGHHGDISVIATDGSVSFLGGDVDRAIEASVGTGGGRAHYAQLGHGGAFSQGDHYGNITVKAGIDAADARGSDADANVLFASGGGSSDDWADINSYSQLGHGGRMDGDTRSEGGNLGRVGETISVHANNDITFTTPGGVYNYTMLGNGGMNADGDHNAHIEVLAYGDITFEAATGAPYQAAYSFERAQADNNSFKNLDRAGNFEATTQGAARVAGEADFQFSRVVQGTMEVQVRDNSGTIVLVLRDVVGDGTLQVVTANTVALADVDADGNGVSGDDTGIFTVGQVVGSYTDSRIQFNQDVNPGDPYAGTDNIGVTYQSRFSDRAFAQLGNGGYDADGNNALTVTPTIGNSGDISIDAGGNVSFTGGSGANTYAQLGHGGTGTTDAHSGTITLGTGNNATLGDRIGGGIFFTGGRGTGITNGDTNNYAHLGHGGIDANGDHNGAISIRAGKDTTGLTEVGLQLKGGDTANSYAQVGHGGYSTPGNYTGNITVDTVGDINLIAGILKEIDFSNTDGTNYVQIGHGGYAATGSQSADIVAVSREGNVFLGGGDAGRALNASFAGSTVAPQGSGRFHYAMVGHGGYDANGSNNGSIFVSAGIDYDETNGVSFHNGTTGYTVLNANADVTLQGGTSTSDNSGERINFAQIGHGGNRADGNHGDADDVISVAAGRDVNVLAGDGHSNEAIIGNGGTFARGDHQADIQVYAERHINVIASDYSAGALTIQYSATGTANASLDRGANLGTSTQTPGDGAGAVRLDSANRYTNDTLVIEIFQDDGTLVGTVADNNAGDANIYAVTDLDLDNNGVIDAGAGDVVAGTVIGVVLNSGRIRFDVDVNPGADGGVGNLVAKYDHNMTDYALAQIGNGGRDADNNNDQTGATAGSSGDIFLAARKGDVNILSGSDAASYAQVGNGGWENVGSHNGDIHVRAGGNLTAKGGETGDNWMGYAQIGHGGNMENIADDAGRVGDYSGVIKVSAGSGELFTSIAKGTFNDVDFAGGDILFETTAGDGSVSLLGGIDTRNYVQIGHGGYEADGNHTGVIGVSAYTDISVQGGAAGGQSYAQIGHGGSRADGDLSGDVHVVSETGDLLVKAGATTEGYALIGHGDDRSGNTLNATGSRSGGIHVIADTITLDRHGQELAWIGHTFRRTTNLANPYSQLDIELGNLDGASSYLGGGYEVIAKSGIINADNGTVNTNGNNINFTDAFRDNFIAPNLAFGDFVYSGQNISVNTTIVGNTANNFTLLSSGDIDVNNSIQNAGTGDVNLIAGAQLAGAPIIDAPSIGGADYQMVDHLFCPPTGFMDMSGIKSDGTQFGLDNGFSLTGTELGQAQGSVSINGSAGGVAVGSANGATNVLGYRVIVQGGNTAGVSEYAQVGFRDVDGTTAATGDIMIEAKEGGVLISGGSQNETYAQVGHGGDDLVNGAGDSSARAFSGMISVRADRGTTVGDIEVLSAGGNRSSQIGHGGNNNEGNLSGDVVVVGNNITMTAGNTRSMSRIGHGGVHDAAGAKGDISGNIYVNYDPDPDHDPGTMDAAVAGGGGAIVMTSGIGSEGSAQIGHGGRFHTGTKTGEIRIENAASVSMTGGNGNRNYMQIGHGGATSSGAISNANISVNITGTDGTDSLVIHGGDRQESYAMIGHGGDSADGSVTASDINVVVADGNVSMAANVNGVSGGNRTHSQIGHGGFNDGAAGDFAGDILVDVQSGGLTMKAGEISNSAYTMIGHGGSNNDALTGHTGAITVNTADDLTITAGLTAAAGTQRFAMIGHGGANSNTANSDNITLDVGTDGTGNLLATAGGADGAFVQVGHGGQASQGNKSGALTVDVAGSTSFLAGSANDTYAQLGHGGRGARGDHGGDIILNSMDTITMTGGNDMRSYAQLGHGGHDADTAGTALGNTGAIMINVDPALVQTAGADILLTAGNGEESYVQVGHGGYANQGDHSSTEIHMTTDGDLVLRSGNGTGSGDDTLPESLNQGQRAYAQIGHGGYNAAGNNAAEICIHVGGTITMDSAAGGTDNTGGFTMIGNGGRNVAGNHSGEITVVSGTSTAGGLTMTAGDADRQFVQIGHGGDFSSGNHSGAMFVVVDDGTGGTAGDLLMSGGAGDGSYVMIGQGDGRGTYGNFGSGNTSGTRSGGIQTFVNNNAVLNVGTGPNSNTHLLHRTTDGGGLSFPGSYLGGTGYQYVVNGTTTGTAGNLARENEGSIVAGNVGGGNVVITNTGDLTLDIPVDPNLQFKDDAFNFIVLATGNLTFNRSIQNAGTGNVALVAGWNGVQDTSSVNYVDPFGDINFCEPEIIPGAIDFNDCDTFGLTAATGNPAIHTGGILTVGTAGQMTATRVGSLLGETILRGNQIDLLSGTAANKATQIGFYGTGVDGITGKTGTIDIQAKAGGFNINAGAGAGSYVQVGHGGAAGGAGGGPTGVLTAPSNPTGLIDGLINISFCEPGAITVTGGTAGAGAFAQIGHGIAGQTGNVAGNISVTNFTDLSLNGSTGDGSAAQIGHGGLGDKSGTITLTGTTTVADQGNLSMTSGGGTDAFTQIGHGGTGITSGAVAAGSDIAITNVVDVSSTGGGDGAYSQIGSGGIGHVADLAGNISILSSGNVALSGGAGTNSYSGIGLAGNGAGNRAGTIDLTGFTGLSLNGSTGDGSSAQIGHGGLGDKSGSITVTGTTTVADQGNLTMTSGDGSGAFTQIGHGGASNTSGAIDSTANIAITNIENATLQGGGGAGFGAYTQIGSGGINHAGSIAGNVTLISSGAISLTGGAGVDAHAQIGAGGRNPRGSITSKTTINGASLTVAGGTGDRAHAQVGLGGSTTNLSGVGHTITGAIDIDTTAGAVTVESGSGENAYAQIGAGGYNGDLSTITSNLTIDTVGGGLIVDASAGGVGSYAQVGSGGLEHDGDKSGNNDIVINSGGNVQLISGANTNAYSQIGVGGSASGGNKNGGVVLNAGAFALSMTSGGGENAYSQIGTGGDRTTGNSGDITDGTTTVTANGGTTMTSMGGVDAYVQIGAGGNSYNTSPTGIVADTILNSNLGVTMNALAGGIDAYVQIGIGGADVNDVLNGNVTVNSAGGAVTMTGGAADDTYVQIGVGGDNSDGAKTSVTTVVGQSIAMTSGAGIDAYTQIGAGGNESSGDITGKTDVDTTAGGITMTSGAGVDAFSQIGAGGINADTTTATGHVSVTEVNTVGGGLIMDALTSGGSDGYVMIGLGGRDTDGKLSGDITAIIDGNVEMRGGNGNSSSVQIGVGGSDADGEKDGAVIVDAGSNTLTMSTGTGFDAFAQIGTGGDSNDGSTGTTFGGGAITDGAVTVTANGGTTMTSGGGGDAYVQIGAGGNEYGLQQAGLGDITGAVILNTDGGLTMNAVAGGNDAYVQVGAGGADADGILIGDVTVNANNGALTMTSGGNGDTYTQIGVGGGLSDGAKTSITTVTSQSIAMTAGAGADAFTQIGAGGNEADGDINGKTDVDTTAGGITMTGGAGADAFARIGAGGINSDAVTAAGHISATEVNTVGGGLIMDALTNGGDDGFVQIGLGGRDVDGKLTGAVTAIIDGNVSMTSGAGDGASTQIGVGGADADGEKDGAVIVNAGANTLTMVSGAGLDSFSQIGNGGDNSGGAVTNGAVTVTANGGTTMTANAGDDAYVQIGAGGNEYGKDVLADSALTGDVVLNSNGGLNMNGVAGGIDGYIMIGSGGVDVDGTILSSTTVNADNGAIIMMSGGQDDGFTQIGAGGDNADGIKTGITKVSGQSIAMTAGTGADAYTMIGAGGNEAQGDITGKTDVDTTGGGITMTSSNGEDAFAQIGAGGLNADTTTAAGHVSATEVNTVGGGLIMDAMTSGGDDGYVQIGLGGRDADGALAGAVTAIIDGNVEMKSGSGNGASTQIGVGGADADGTKDGAVIVDAGANTLTMTGGSVGAFGTGDAFDSFAHIGSGGDIGSGDITNGAVTVTANGGTTMTSGDGQDAFVQIGAGGNEYGNDATDSNITGAVILNSNLGLTMNSAVGDADSYTQVGSGGINVDGTTTSTTTVNAAGGAVSLTAGSLRDTYSQIGAGGSGGDGALVNAHTTVTAATVDLTSTDGRDAYTLIGAGGGISSAPGAFNGIVTADTMVTASGAITMQAGGGTNAFSQIGLASNTGMGTIDVSAGGALSVTAGSGRGASAQIGHGVQDAVGTGNSGTIFVNAVGDLTVASGGGRETFAQIGHGTEGQSLSHSGGIYVNTDGAATVTALGAGNRDGYAMIGHGGAGVAMDQTGFVTVITGGNLDVLGGGAAANTFAHIGHGGANDANGNFNGSISVVSGGDVNVTGGALADSGAMIGHGSADGIATGTRTGGLNIYTSHTTPNTGIITLTDGAAGAAIVTHQTADGLGSVDYSSGAAGGDQGFSLVGLGGINMASTLQQQTGNGGALITLAETIGNASAVDDVLIASGGATDLTIGSGDLANVSFNSANNVNLLSGGNLSILTGLQNAGAGDMNLLAGWTNSGATATTAPTMGGVYTATPALGLVTLPDFQPVTIPATVAPAEFGANNGQVLIGDGNQSVAIAVGTAGGLNQIAGSGVVVQGSNTTAGASAQIGFNNADTTPTTGDIKVTTHGDGLSVLAGTAVGAFAQIGDGGAGGNSNLDGDITIDLTAGTALAVPTAAGVLQVTGGGDQAYAQIGNGGLGTMGTKFGDVAVTAGAATVQGGDGSDAYARVGNGGSRGSGDIVGSVSVTSTTGNVSVLGGSDDFTEASIGNGGTGYAATTVTGGTTVASAMDVVVTAGAGVQASAQIGSGGLESNVDTLTGDVAVTAANDVRLTGGTDIRSYSQIGNGGATAAGSMSGAIAVDSGNNIIMVATDGDKGAYTKIGHGDDMFSPVSGIDALGGTGARSGDITVVADADIVITDGMIGHVNNISNAVALGGTTQIQASEDASTDPSGGDITADSNSEFAGVDGLRFYVPERSNNDVAAGALLNGVPFVGAEVDPSVLQRDDEFTVNITGAAPSMPLEHTNVIGSGPAPTNAGNFAFYYNSIELTAPPVVTPPGGSGSGSGTEGGSGTAGGGFFGGGFFGGSQVPFGSLAEALGLVPQDRTANDWQRENEGLFTGFNAFGMFFDGFDHYDSNGTPIYHYVFANELDSSLMTPVEFEDVLERQERILEEEEEQNEEDANAEEGAE